MYVGSCCIDCAFVYGTAAEIAPPLPLPLLPQPQQQPHLAIPLAHADGHRRTSQPPSYVAHTFHDHEDDEDDDGADEEYYRLRATISLPPHYPQHAFAQEPPLPRECDYPPSWPQPSRPPATFNEPIYTSPAVGQTTSAAERSQHLYALLRPLLEPLKKKRERRSSLPKHATEVLFRWLVEHADKPYPDEREKAALMHATGLSKVQVRRCTMQRTRALLYSVRART